MNEQKLDDAAAEAEAHDKVGAVEIAHYLTARSHTMISAGNVLEFWNLTRKFFLFWVSLQKFTCHQVQHRSLSSVYFLLLS